MALSKTAPLPPSLPPSLPEAPVAPSLEAWAALSSAEQQRLAAELTARTDEYLAAEQALEPPEGDEHIDAWTEARETLRSYFGDRGPRGLYVAANMSVLYPERVGVAPDLIAVRDVELRKRESWIVHVEGKGPDLAIEFCKAGDRNKDFVRNVTRYAVLGIREYFAVDLLRGHLRGWRLPEGGRSYQPLVPQAGRYLSQVLDLELVLVDGRLRFFQDNALLQSRGEMLDFLARIAEEERTRADEERARADEQQARAAEERARAAEERARAAEERSRSCAALREALLLVLRLRGLAVGDEEQRRIAACADPDTLRRYLARAGEAADTAAVLTDG